MLPVLLKKWKELKNTNGKGIPMKGILAIKETKV